MDEILIAQVPLYCSVTLVQHKLEKVENSLPAQQAA